MRSFVVALLTAVLLLPMGAASGLGARQAVGAGSPTGLTVRLPLPPLGGVTLAAAKLRLTGMAGAHAPAALTFRLAGAALGVELIAAEHLDRASETYTILIALVHGAKPALVHGARSAASLDGGPVTFISARDYLVTMLVGPPPPEYGLNFWFLPSVEGLSNGIMVTGRSDDRAGPWEHVYGAGPFAGV